jgi:hypothetical protein
MRVAWLVLVGCLVGCKKQAEPATPASEAPVREAPAEAAAPEEEESPYLDVANFNRVVESHAGEVAACWRQTVGTAADAPTGRVKTTLVVDGDGKVKQVLFDAQRSTLRHEGLQACMRERMAGWKFNIPLTGADSPMPYTFDLRPEALLAE